jgi:hypothetical protein
VSTARVDFTRGAAERIAAVVRKVEQGDRDGAALTFRKVETPAGGGSIRIGTFSGAWSVGETAAVTFKYVPNTPNTVSAINLFFSLPDDGQKDCAISKERGTWHLIQWQWATIDCDEEDDEEEEEEEEGGSE